MPSSRGTVLSPTMRSRSNLTEPAENLQNTALCKYRICIFSDYRIHSPQQVPLLAPAIVVRILSLLQLDCFRDLARGKVVCCMPNLYLSGSFLHLFASILFHSVYCLLELVNVSNRMNILINVASVAQWIVPWNHAFPTPTISEHNQDWSISYSVYN
jgi:hypothetical protein